MELGLDTPSRLGPTGAGLVDSVNTHGEGEMNWHDGATTGVRVRWTALVGSTQESRLVFPEGNCVSQRFVSVAALARVETDDGSLDEEIVGFIQAATLASKKPNEAEPPETLLWRISVHADDIRGTCGHCAGDLEGPLQSLTLRSVVGLRAEDDAPHQGTITATDGIESERVGEFSLERTVLDQQPDAG